MYVYFRPNCPHCIVRLNFNHVRLSLDIERLLTYLVVDFVVVCLMPVNHLTR